MNADHVVIPLEIDNVRLDGLLRVVAANVVQVEIDLFFKRHPVILIADGPKNATINQRDNLTTYSRQNNARCNNSPPQLSALHLSCSPSRS